MPSRSFLVFAVVLVLPAHAQTPPKATRTLKAFVQTRPGGARGEAEIPIFEVPVDLPTVKADAAPLDDDDLVLGVVLGGKALCFPVRFLSLFEIVDHQVGGTPIAPSW